MAQLQIKTPRGTLLCTAAGNAEIRWNEGFGAERSAALQEAQSFVDSEVLRRSSPYLPFRDGFLEKSGVLGTELGSGEVDYIVPYAARLYYHPEYDFSHELHRDAGGQWFERMKVDHADDILRGAREILGANSDG